MSNCAICTVNDLYEVLGGGTPSTKVKEYWEGDIPWITSADILDIKKIIPRKNISPEGIKNSAANIAPANSIIVVTRVGLGKIALTEREISFSQDCQALIPISEITVPKYALYYLSKAVEKFKYSNRGTTISGVTKKQLKDLKFLLPPPSEQHRIVSKIEELFSELDNGIENLKKAQAQLKTYRQAVLKHAFEGKLTVEWRRKNNPEPADKLLEQIKEEREKYYQQQLEEWKRACEKAQKKGKKKPLKPQKAKNLAPFKNEELERLPKLPKGWSWAKPQWLCKNYSNAICAGPFGTIFKAKDFKDSGIPIIFLRHVSPGKYLTHKPGFMDKKKWEEIFLSYSVYGGELLITKLGEPPGICAIYPEGIGPAMVTPDIIKMDVDHSVASSKYLMHYFNSEVARKFTFGIAYGTTRLRMTLPIFRNMPIAYPSLLEQKVIVQEIESRLSVCDNLEQTIEDSLQKAEALRQSILKKAFEGKLVHQNPNDEPAEKLLERIKKEKAELEAKAKSAKQKSKKRPN